MAEKETTIKIPRLECSLCLGYLKQLKLSCFHVFHKLQDSLHKAKENDNTNCNNCETEKTTGYCNDCGDFLCNNCQSVHKTTKHLNSHRLSSLEELKEQETSLVPPITRPVQEKLTTGRQANSSDSSIKLIDNQRAAIEDEIIWEIDEQHALLNERKIELVKELQIVTQEKIKALAPNIEITEGDLSSRNLITGGTDDEVVEMRIEKVSTEPNPSTFSPEAIADMKLDIKGKERLQQACRNFLSIYDGDQFSSENSKITGNSFIDVTIEKTKTVYFESLTKKNKKFKGELDIKAELVHTKSKMKLKCELVSQYGRHEISYCPLYRGKHELHISVNEVPVRGSPFPIIVIGLQRKPAKILRDFNKLRGIVNITKGQLVIIEGSYISVLTVEGENIRSFGQLSNAFGIAVDQNDNIYIVENNNHRLCKFSTEGLLLQTAGSKGNGNLQFDSPMGICFNRKDSTLYVVDQYNYRIQVVTTDLKFVRCFSIQKHFNRKYGNSPLFAAFDSASNIYVTVNGSDQVQVFTSTGNFLRAFSQKTDNQKLNNPYAIAIDSSDNVYVSENGFHCVSVFTSHGVYITTIGGQGSKEGQFIDIRGLFIDCNDFVIVSDCGNNRLQIF